MKRVHPGEHLAVGAGFGSGIIGIATDATPPRALPKRPPRPKKGTRPQFPDQASADRYAARVVASSIDADLGDPAGWLRGGIEHPTDVHRVKKAGQKLAAHLMKRGSE